jgi:hypothetical protein
MVKKGILLFVLSSMGVFFFLFAQVRKPDPRLKNAFRQEPRNGWTFVHLEGTPAEIGFQHGYLMADEISDLQKVCVLEMTHDSKKSWDYFRAAAREMMWPHIEAEYREELQGITEGINSRGIQLDLWDVVAMNGLMEWDYYVKAYDKNRKAGSADSSTVPEHCSAFAATGSYTKDGKVVLAHNNWSSYLEGARWTIIFDIAPAKGHRFIMDGLPGLISSGDDFGLNSAGIMITETTISGFEGYDPKGIPEFVRARKAMQYSSTIDDFVRIMKEGNNGGYANDWLVADRKTNEIASLELGLKNVTLDRKRDGYFVGSNFPINSKLAREETHFDLTNLSNSANARHIRWEQLMAQYKGKIDVAAAQIFLGDHFDSYQEKNEPNERTLCGHIDLSPRGSPTWQPPYGIAGAVQNKVTDSAMAERMTLSAAAGHACGLAFKAKDHLKAHPEYIWQKDSLRDMPSYQWTTFTSARYQAQR